jgi:AraC-like DNA-binding protein
MHWLWHRRIEASYCALKEGHVRNVTEAALRFGFSDLSHFSRAFKKTYGMSPLALKELRPHRGRILSATRAYDAHTKYRRGSPTGPCAPPCQ